MIYGIGTDIVEISRIRRLIDLYNDKFIKRILSKDEITGSSDKNKYNYLAGRLAGKEAIIKAMGGRYNLGLRDIEILNDSNGRPFIKNIGRLRDSGGINIDTEIHIHISISHEREYAIAFAVIEKG